MPEEIKITLTGTFQDSNFYGRRRMWDWKLKFGSETHASVKPEMEPDQAVHAANLKLDHLLKNEETELRLKRRADRIAKEKAEFRLPTVG